MVIYSKIILTVLAAVCFSSISNAQFAARDLTVAKELAKSEVQSASQVDEFETPRATFDRLVNCLASGDLKGYLLCFEDNKRDKLLAGRKLDESEITQASQKMKKVEFSNHTIEFFAFHSNKSEPTIESIVSTVRKNHKITEKMTITLVDTNRGWKVRDIQVTNLGREKLQSQ